MGNFLNTVGLATAFLFAATMSGAYAADSYGGRNLNPYHERQLLTQINQCASGVLACTDTEKRCLKQQELCQLLIRADRFDEALQVAYNIYQTKSADDERRAAHHYLMAEIYNRKMKASRTMDAMLKNRQFALSAAQEVVEKDYPSRWQISERARALIRELNDSKTMGHVRQRVASREGSGDSAKLAIAEAQRKYLDATQGGGRRATVSPQHAANFVRVAPEQKSKPDSGRLSGAVDVSGRLRTSPKETRVVSPVQYESGEVFKAGRKLNESGLLTSQPGVPTVNHRQPILVNGTAVKQQPTVDEIVQNNLAQLLESARKRKEKNTNSPYATGQLPSINR